MDDAHLIVAVAAEIVTRYGDKAVPRLHDDAEIAAGLGDDPRLRCGPAHFRPYLVHRHPGGHILHPQLQDEAAALYRMRRAECGFRGDGLRRRNAYIAVLAAGKYPDGGGIVRRAVGTWIRCGF
jgi:hypothetical protein